MSWKRGGACAHSCISLAVAAKPRPEGETGHQGGTDAGWAAKAGPAAQMTGPGVEGAGSESSTPGRVAAWPSFVTEAEGPATLPASGWLDRGLPVTRGEDATEEAETKPLSPMPSTSECQSPVRFLRRRKQ